MNLLEAYAALTTNGIALLRAAANCSDLEHLIRPDHAAELARLSTTYFGPTTHRHLQQTALAHAERLCHGLDELRLIEKYAAKLKTKKLQWQLREHLCGTESARIAAEARKILRGHTPTPSPKPGVTIRRGTGTSPDTLSYTGASSLVTRLYDRLDQPNPDTALRELLDGTSAHPSSSAATTPQAGQSPEAAPHVIIRIDDLAKAEQGDQDTLLTLTDGSRITGAEYAAKRLHDIGFVTLISPVEGPVNLYRAERFANQKQRLMAAAENPLCPWPRCRQPARKCQIHHIRPWKTGGETNAANLTVACKYHNGVNDDGGPARRGTLARHAGTVIWIPPGAIESADAPPDTPQQS